jgi:hypothetical protein
MNPRTLISFSRTTRFTPALVRAHGGHSHASQFSGDGSDKTPETREGQRITLIGGAVNLGMAIGSASVGYLSGSSSLMAHAVIQLRISSTMKGLHFQYCNTRRCTHFLTSLVTL